MNIPPAALGTMKMGSQLDEQESFNILDTYVGLCEASNVQVLIDTAEIYSTPMKYDKMGNTEVIVGNWIKKRANRHKIILASKVSGPLPDSMALRKREVHLTGKEVANDAQLSQQDLTPEQINRALEASLKKLEVEYIDLYQLHWPSRPAPLFGKEVFTEKMKDGVYIMKKEGVIDPEGVPFEEIVRCMGELIQQGKIRYWGLSNETSYGIVRYCETAKLLGVPLPVTIQNDFSLADRRFDGELAEACSYYGIKLLAYGPLCGGTLTGKYFFDHLKDSSKRLRSTWRHVENPKSQPRYHAKPTMDATRKYAIVAEKNNLTLVELALGFCATRYYMGSVIFGANSPKHVKENFEAIINAENNMTKEVLSQIEKIHAERPNPNVDYSSV